MIDDLERTSLIEALEEAQKADEGTTLLGRPGADFKRIMTAAIEGSPSYKAVAGDVLYCADSLVVLHSAVLIPHLAYTSMDVASRVDWLLKILRTKTASGYLVAFVWGLALDGPVRLSEAERLVPFDALRNSRFKKRIEERATRYRSPLPWIASNFWQLPKAAYVRDIQSVNYIGKTREPIDVIESAVTKARDSWTIVEMLGAGRPLVFGTLFEYEDEELDISTYENAMSFSHAEVAPMIDKVIAKSAADLSKDFEQFSKLPAPYKKRLLRSSARYNLSQCRREKLDRVLDLALAYEVMLTGNSENVGAVSWKLAVRAAQVAGGTIAERVDRRKLVNDFYSVRSSATHGGTIKGPDSSTLEKASDLFPDLFRRLVMLGTEPTWQEIEMEGISP